MSQTGDFMGSTPCDRAERLVSGCNRHANASTTLTPAGAAFRRDAALPRRGISALDFCVLRFASARRMLGRDTGKSLQGASLDVHTAI
jgi:hypothetical protein